jgi:hypothetical protein
VRAQLGRAPLTPAPLAGEPPSLTSELPSLTSELPRLTSEPPGPPDLAVRSAA